MTVRSIEVVGLGGYRCEETRLVVRQIVEEAKLDCVVECNDSVERLAELGVREPPALVLDGRVVLQGRIPKPAELRKLLGLPDPLAGSATSSAASNRLRKVGSRR